MSQRPITYRRFILPPVPAPYLAELPLLPSDQLDTLTNDRDTSPTARATAQQNLADLCRQIRQARTSYERANGFIILPERPAA